MPLICSDTRLCDVINHEPSVIPVVNRFGIYLGVGDYAISDACASRHIDEEFFLAILNTFINENYFPEKALRSFNVADLVGYMSKTNAYYSNYQLPNIERHFNLLLKSAHGSNNNLELMMRFFEGLKSDLLRRIAFDDECLFPAVGQGGAVVSEQEAVDFDCVIEDKISDLKNMFIKHLAGDHDQNLCYGVVVAIVTLEKDIRQNNRIRRHILLPLASINRL